MLKYKADIRTLLHVAFYFTLTALAWFGFGQWHWSLKITSVIVLSVLSFSCAVVVHNTIHVPIFKSKALNKLFQIILSMTYGHPVSGFVVGHNFSHHMHTGKDKDIARTSFMRFRWNFLNQFLFFFMTAHKVLLAETKWVWKMWLQKRWRWVTQYYLELLPVFGIKIFLLFVDWQLALWLVWIPHLYAQWGIIGTNFWQHDGCDLDHPYNHSRNFTGRLLNWIVFNNGYHGLHHNQPTLHWSLLPRVYEREFKPQLHPNLNRGSLVAYLWQSCVWPGVRVDYLGRPIARPPKASGDRENWVFEEPIHDKSAHLGVEPIK